MKKFFVNKLTKGTDLNEEPFAVVSAKKNLTKNGSEYYRLELADKTGSIVANIWGNEIPNCDTDALVEGSVVNTWGQIEEFAGKLQYRITSLGAALGYDEADFIPVSDNNPEDMKEILFGHISGIKSDTIKKFFNALFSDNKFKSKYIEHPAAKSVHHGYKHGILDHVVEMLEMATAVLPFYPLANADFVKAGIILHDVGKLEEMEKNKLVFDRTVEGNLIGHIIQGYEFLIKHGEGTLTEDELLHLKHIVLSHHGILEYGSPVVPKTIEAVIVSQVDDASAKIRTYEKIIKENLENSDSFSKYDNFIGTSIYTNPYKE